MLCFFRFFSSLHPTRRSSHEDMGPNLLLEATNKTLSKESILATLLVFGIGISRSAGCTRNAQAQHTEEVLFDLKSSERAFHSSAERIQRQSRAVVNG
jgi:hypothetical protein